MWKRTDFPVFGEAPGSTVGIAPVSCSKDSGGSKPVWAT